MSDFKYLILGGGMVAGYAAQEFVSRGVQRGELAIVSSDDAPPYERPPLSKDFLAGTTDESGVFINPLSFYEDAGIVLHLSTTVDRVDAAEHKLYTTADDAFGFEKLLVATGARVRTLDVPGAALTGIMYLRSLGDSRRLRDAYKEAKRAVVVGAGFIGMEVASSLPGAASRQRCCFRRTGYGRDFLPHRCPRSLSVTTRNAACRSHAVNKSPRWPDQTASRASSRSPVAV